MGREWNCVGDGIYQRKGVSDFSLRQIYESGQAFRFKEVREDTFLVVHQQHWAIVSEQGDTITLQNTTLQECEDVWNRYFDLERDYHTLKQSFLGLDDYLDKAISFGEGLRILNQDIFEMIITFIISANNHIPRIKNGITKICEFAGTSIGEYDGEVIYAFPKAEQIQKLSQEQWDGIKLGYREKYIKKTVDMIVNQEIDIAQLPSLDTLEAQKELMKLSGVGEKVADCILLFSMAKYDAFPMDTWMKKVMQRYYPDESMGNIRRVRSLGVELFGSFAGIAQQYLFYYEREQSKRRK